MGHLWSAIVRSGRAPLGFGGGQGWQRNAAGCELESGRPRGLLLSSCSVVTSSHVLGDSQNHTGPAERAPSREHRVCLGRWQAGPEQFLSCEGRC